MMASLILFLLLLGSLIQGDSLGLCQNLQLAALAGRPWLISKGCFEYLI